MKSPFYSIQNCISIFLGHCIGITLESEEKNYNYAVRQDWLTSYFISSQGQTEETTMMRTAAVPSLFPPVISQLRQPAAAHQLVSQLRQSAADPAAPHRPPVIAQLKQPLNLMYHSPFQFYF
jgi:hypothetical protein